MPYDVSKKVSREVKEIRKSYKMREHVWWRVFLAKKNKK